MMGSRAFHQRLMHPIHAISDPVDDGILAVFPQHPP